MRHILQLAFLLSACSPGGHAQDRVIELIADPSFSHGVRGTDRDGKEQLITWNGEESTPPVWRTAHHGSKSCVADTAYQQRRPGGFTFKDDYAWLDFHPAEEPADLILGLNAFREYSGRFRAPGDPWPHLYVSQRISNPNGHLGAGSPSLADMARIDFSASVRLLYDHRNASKGHNPRVHASQFLYFLTIQNLNRASPGHGDYYWFGICFYDDRKPVTGLHAMRDAGSAKKKGTGKFIYNIGMQPFTDKVVAGGEWVDVRGDLLPHILAGLKEAWKQGYLPDSHNPADYRVGGTVIGWEIPGLNDAAMALKNLHTSATLRPAPPSPGKHPAQTGPGTRTSRRQTHDPG